MKAIVLFLLLLSSPAMASAEEEAIQYASLAAYKQFGIENAVSTAIENNISKKYIDVFTKINPIITALASKRVELIWNF